VSDRDGSHDVGHQTMHWVLLKGHRVLPMTVDLSGNKWRIAYIKLTRFVRSKQVSSQRRERSYGQQSLLFLLCSTTL
jgi:hypothetical protein